MRLFFEVIVIAAILALSLRRGTFLLASLLPSRSLPGPVTLPGITMLVPAWNEYATAGRLLGAFSKLSYPPDKLFFIFVCDGCVDGTPALFQSWADNRTDAQVVELTQHAGKAAALNAGLLRAKTEIVVVMDADLEPRPDFLTELAGAFTDRRVGGAAAFLNPANADENMITRYAGVTSWVHQLVTSAGSDRLGLNPPTLGAAAFRKSALEQIGGFPEVPLGEDVATSASLTHMGWKTRFVAAAVADNAVASDLATFWQQHVRWARATFVITRSGKPQSSASWLQRAELGVTSAGYADRLVFAAAVIGAAAGALPVWLPLLYLLFPGLEIIAALLKAGIRRRLASFLLSVVVLFFVDLAGSAVAIVAQLMRRPLRWQNPRTVPGDKNSSR